jgi:hypothetical protein
LCLTISVAARASIRQLHCKRKPTKDGVLIFNTLWQLSPESPHLRQHFVRQPLVKSSQMGRCIHLTIPSHKSAVMRSGRWRRPPRYVPAAGKVSRESIRPATRYTGVSLVRQSNWSVKNRSCNSAEPERNLPFCADTGEFRPAHL